MINKKNTKKEEIKLEPKNKRLIDRNSIFHFLFGCLLGIFFGLLLELFLISLILGVLLIPLLEYAVHKIATGHSTLTSKNALADLSFAFIGFLLFLILFQFVF